MENYVGTWTKASKGHCNASLLIHRCSTVNVHRAVYKQHQNGISGGLRISPPSTTQISAMGAVIRVREWKFSFSFFFNFLKHFSTFWGFSGFSPRNPSAFFQCFSTFQKRNRKFYSKKGFHWRRRKKKHDFRLFHVANFGALEMKTMKNFSLFTFLFSLPHKSHEKMEQIFCFFKKLKTW